MLIVSHKAISDIEIGELFCDLLVVIQIHSTPSVSDFEYQVPRARIIADSDCHSTLSSVPHRIIYQIHENRNKSIIIRTDIFILLKRIEVKIRLMSS